MPIRLDAKSRRLVKTLTTGTLLGIFDHNRGTIRLFEAGPVVDTKSRIFPTHRELLGAGIVRLGEVWGFSVEIANGHVRTFYRSSILNRDYEYDDFAIPRDIMNEILDALSLTLAADFKDFP